MNRKILLVITATFASAAVLVGCGGQSDKISQPFNDAPTKGEPDETAARIFAMPDGFNNVAIKCIPRTHSGVATLYHGDSPYGGVVIFQNAEVCP
jgi:hypothetical protein